MTMINMLRGGKANGSKGNQYTQNMYPRPDYMVSEMAKNDGWENRPDAFHYNSLFDLCACWNSGAVERAKAADETTTECSLEVGDTIPLVWVPNKTTVQAITLNVVSGVAGVTVGVVARHFTSDEHINGAGSVAPTLALTGIDTTPIEPAAPIDQAYLDSFKCGDRIDMAEFCPSCDNDRGPMVENWPDSPFMVGGTFVASAGGLGGGINTNAVSEAGLILDLVIESLPAEGLDCANACLKIELGARVRVPRAGN